MAGVHLWAFVAVAAIVIIAPGPDTVIVTKNALLHGRRAGLASAVGVNLGLSTWTVAAAFGLAALVRESAVAFTVIKLLGAAYLVWLGLSALRAARRSGGGLAASATGTRARLTPAGGLRQGLLSNLGNPKIAVFFTALLPQFVAPGRAVLVPFLLLGAVFVAMTLAWLVGYVLLISRAVVFFSRPRVKAVIDALSGVALIGLGAALAFERR
jgi:RhtB (resistance to homoserine/threonine) family protein